MNKEEIKRALEPLRHPYEIAIYSSENYFNCGAIIRTAHSFLCKKIWMVDFDKYYKKATMGSHRFEHIEKTNLKDFLEINKNRNIIAFERRKGLNSLDIFNFKYPENPIMFFGSEKFGVPQEVLDRFPAITIPLDGIHNDLNIATAAGIVMYDFLGKMRK